MSFGRHPRTLREQAGLSRAELARRAGVPVNTLHHWEDGRGFPGVPAVLRLVEALGVPAERLAKGVGDLVTGVRSARDENPQHRCHADRPAIMRPPALLALQYCEPGIPSPATTLPAGPPHSIQAPP